MVTIERVTSVREAGHRTRDESAETLFHGPAQLSSPSRTWERLSALEGALTARINVNTTADLARANRVIVNRAPAGYELGAFEVITSTPSGARWSLGLGKRRLASAS